MKIKPDHEISVLLEDLAALPPEERKAREARKAALISKENSNPNTNPIEALLTIRELARRYELSKK